MMILVIQLAKLKARLLPNVTGGLVPYTLLAIAGNLGGLFLMWWNGR